MDKLSTTPNIKGRVGVTYNTFSKINGWNKVYRKDNRNKV